MASKKKIDITEPIKSLNKTYVGLDLSYSGTGVVLLVAGPDGVIIDSKGYEFKAGTSSMDFVTRARILVDSIVNVLPNPESASIYIEGAAFSAEFNAFMLGELSGAVKYELGSRGYPISLVPPTSLKKFATGSGAAQKTYVSAIVAQKWGYVHPSNNVTDAYVLARMALEHWEPEVKAPKAKKTSRTKSF